MPNSEDELYEFIFIDINCGNANQIFELSNAKLLNYRWITFDSKANEVYILFYRFFFIFGKNFILRQLFETGKCQ